MNGVQVVQISPTAVELRWKSSSSNDMIADSALALLLGIEGSPATAKRKSMFFPSIHSYCCMLLEAERGG